MDYNTLDESVKNAKMYLQEVEATIEYYNQLSVMNYYQYPQYYYQPTQYYYQPPQYYYQSQNGIEIKNNKKNKNKKKQGLPTIFE